jgi:hypothetical protein
MSGKSISSIFNEYFIQFINFVEEKFPNDVNIATAKKGILFLKSNNPSQMKKIWFEYITKKYKKEIDNEDIDFFLNKNYKDDLSTLVNSNGIDKIIKFIDQIKDPIKNMDETEQKQAMIFIKTLTNLSELN